MSETFSKILLEGEQVLWEGKSNKKVFIFTAILSSLIMIGIALFLYNLEGGSDTTCTINGVETTGAACQASMRFAAYILFALTPFSLLFSFLKYNASKFAITNQRVLIKPYFVLWGTRKVLFSRIKTSFVKKGFMGLFFPVKTINIDAGRTSETTNEDTGKTKTKKVYEKINNISQADEVNNIFTTAIEKYNVETNSKKYFNRDTAADVVVEKIKEVF